MKALSLRKKLSRAKSSEAVLPRAEDAPDTSPEPPARFAQTRESAIAYGEELLHALSADLRQGELSQLAAIWEMLPYHIGVVATADFAIAQQARTPTPPSPVIEPAVPTYYISSMFLASCHSYLTSQPRGFERMHLVTGIKVSSNQRTLDHMVQVPLAEQSAVGALANQSALQQALMEMDAWGNALHGLFHSHPGQGALATRPSSTDLATHDRYERGGYPLVGAIFVKDGYVRFFAHHPFTITIYGKAIQTINGDEHVYKIENSARSVSYETVATEDER